MQYVERPLTLPEMTLAPEFGASITHLEFSAFGGSFAANLINLNAGASFGIIDDLTAYVVPLVMTIGTASGADPDDQRCGASPREAPCGTAVRAAMGRPSQGSSQLEGRARSRT